VGGSDERARDDPDRRPVDRLASAALAAAIRLFEWLPLDAGVALGARFGAAWARMGGPRTRRVRAQLARALPEADAARREAWDRGVFVHLGRGLAELLILSGRRRRELLARVRIEGLEHVDAARRTSPTGGVLVVTAHVGNWELACARMAESGLPLSVVVRPQRWRVVDRALGDLRGVGASAARAGAALETIPRRRAAIRVARALEAGRVVVVALDQDAGRREGIFVRFFGQLASTRNAPVALATRRGAPVLPVFIHRDPDGRGHLLRIHPALQLESEASDDEEAARRNVQRVTARIEGEIRASPDQWIWTHRRWRTRPPSPPGAAPG
jgi:KDO2-lipid IV(A) lauroyltransferase